ncbi:MAG: TlpA family protein disulfide reductase [Bryobacteraceae bacterium]|nr:TlpA family protein disulfide reductase [Bryobacteraceae bacterium]MCX7604424.1 TlpA family protein disulfide reductase [Bryobacteraceae bacterium]
MLQPGNTAPQFTLELAGDGMLSLAAILEAGPAVFAFFKVTCPTCQMALPYLARIRGGELQVFGISQDDAERTREFQRVFGVDLPMLLDPAAAKYPASRAFGIQYVPSVFLVETDGRISWAAEAFDRRAYEELAQRAGRPMFHAEDRVPLYKPG